MSAGRAPALTGRGRLLLIGAALLLLAGAALGVWVLVALGVVTFALLAALYLAFFPSGILIWRRHVEFAWRLPGASERTERGAALVAGQPFRLELTVRNHAPLPCGLARLDVVAPSVVPPLSRPALQAEGSYGGAELVPKNEAPVLLRALIGARVEVRLGAEARVLSPGFYCLHGAAMEVSDRLGVAAVRAYFPSPLPLRVLPRSFALPLLPALRPTGSADPRIGRHRIRLRGVGGELRELREHVPGDPFKQIAWKATARTGRLMVRELEREARVAHYLLVDIAATMREGAPERSKLHHAVELCAAYTRATLAAGERVGLITFDGHVHRHLRPDDRAASWLRIAEALLDAMTPVDAELTEVTDGELVATVARYLRHQEGVEVRLARAPAIDDPVWSQIATGPDGRLYDLRVLHRTVDKLLAKHGAQRTHVGNLEAPDPEMARLRRFCRVRGIELPYRRVPALPDGRMRALVDALDLASRARGPQRILILSDLRGVGDPGTSLGRVVALARRRGHRPACVLPSVLAYADVADGPAARRAAEILAWEERRREESARHRMERMGVPVVTIGPDDGLATVMGRLGSRRNTGARP